MCITTNPYGRSEQHFTLSQKSSEDSYVVPNASCRPSITQDDLVSSMNRTSTIIHSRGSTINTVSVNNTRSVTPVVGILLCIVLVLVILAFTLCFCKCIYFKKM